MNGKQEAQDGPCVSAQRHLVVYSFNCEPAFYFSHFLQYMDSSLNAVLCRHMPPKISKEKHLLGGRVSIPDKLGNFSNSCLVELVFVPLEWPLYLDAPIV